MCGIFGIMAREKNVSLDIYEALTMLQHRGQDAAGMVSFDGRYFHSKKDVGMVKDVFTEGDISALVGSAGLGHVRYPTAGSLSAKEAQPFFVNAPFGMYLVHNGNLTNTEELRERVTAKYHRHLRTDSDTEILLNVFANALYKIIKEKPKMDPTDAVFEAVCMTMDRIRGAYSVIVIIDKVGLVAFRDPHGIRPLALGKRSIAPGAEEYAFASEDIAFAPIGFEPIRDVAPGEAVLVDFDGNLHTHQCQKGTRNPCIFEYIYLARPDSMIENISVYKTQLRLGDALARQIKKAKLPIDSVIPVPDSSRPAALQIAHALGVKYREGLVKNRYVGRTFIMPDQITREKSVRQKLNAIPLEFERKSVLLVDDSIVRGTTMKQIIKMCRDVGAKKVYVASAAPPVRFPNVYGVDMPTRTELIAHDRTIEEVQKMIGADKLFYQTVRDMIKAARHGNMEIKRFEDSCFTGDYVTGDISEEYLDKLEKSRGPRQSALII
jgi:amidophosphoribosyltransferase